MAVAAGQAIAVADITAGHLVYQPPSGAAGSPLATFTFQVQDNGGTANGGIDTDPTVRTMTLNVTGNANASLSGFVYVDLNRNSAKDSTEPVLGGILMTLSGTASDGTAVNTTTRTIGDGSYSFTGLAAGTYSISEAQPGALFDGLTAAGSLGGTSGTNLISNISLSEGAAGTGYNFSEAGPSVITINLFLASTPSAQDLYDKLVGFNRLGAAAAAAALAAPRASPAITTNSAPATSSPAASPATSSPAASPAAAPLASSLLASSSNSASSDASAASDGVGQTSDATSSTPSEASSPAAAAAAPLTSSDASQASVMAASLLQTSSAGDGESAAAPTASDVSSASDVSAAAESDSSAAEATNAVASSDTSASDDESTETQAVDEALSDESDWSDPADAAIA